ncbi:hypothetical protein F4819DRAFT_454794 [Hypoxylon fuscum]|nr:hypothetical protein F4819DRAFT_454794 [Hypoxylon fuscum]
MRCPPEFEEKKVYNCYCPSALPVSSSPFFIRFFFFMPGVLGGVNDTLHIFCGAIALSRLLFYFIFFLRLN